MEKLNLTCSVRFHLPWRSDCGTSSCWKETDCLLLWRITLWKCTEVSRIWLVHWLLTDCDRPTGRPTDWLINLKAISELHLASVSKRVLKRIRSYENISTYLFISTVFKLTGYEGFCTGLVLEQRHKVNLKMMFVVFMRFYQMVTYFIVDWKVTIKYRSKVLCNSSYESCSKTGNSFWVNLCNEVIPSVFELHSRLRMVA